MAATLTLVPKSTALVAIDLQPAVVGRDTQPYPASQVVENSRKLAEALREKGGTVIFVRVDLADFHQIPADEKMQLPDSPPPELSEIVAAAGVKPGDVIVTKRSWGAFAKTDLEEQLRSRGIDTVILTGIATNIGVESTLRQGTGLGFGFITVEDACTTFSSEMQAFAFQKIFPRISHVRTTDQVLEALAN